ncbi:hypothetical protein BGZ58_002860 [Dissophora ornata]|nr:hypothetical protein BGZ58_002860 [Dissophora ornata]
MTASLLLDRNEQEKFSRAKSPFMGLLASRVSCVDCGYTAAIRHSTFDNLSLTVPLQYSCSLEDCLDSFIHLDTITDFNCRKCTVMNAGKDLERKIDQGRRAQAEEQESQKKERNEDVLPSTENGEDQEQTKPLLGANAKTPKSPSEKRKARRRFSTSPASSKTPMSRITLAEMEKIKGRLDQCLANNIEMDLSPLELTPVRSTRTTKHSMIAKPPQALCLHLNRSMFTSSGQIAKNPCKVQFGARLDFTRFTTSGHLTTVATKSMSRRGSVTEVNGSSTSGMGSGIDVGQGATGAASMFSRRRSIGPVSLSSPWTTHVNSEVVADVRLNVNGREYARDEEDDDKVIYELWAVIVHLGSHNSGHFVTYRRIPFPSSLPASTSRSRNRDSSGTEDVDDVDDLVVSNGDDKAPKSSDKWWRISDEDVQIVDWSVVRNVEAYMLFFEKEIS